MTTNRYLISLIFSLFIYGNKLCSQSLQPGFNKSELLEAMYVSVRTGSDSSFYTGTLETPEPRSKRVYQSPETGLKNLWELWVSENQTAIISTRGTVDSDTSWLANNFMAMLPAHSYLVLAVGDTFRYQLAENPKAAVHAGWLFSTAFLVRDMLPKIDSCYRSGIKNYIITGHSQGGAISYLVSAYFLDLQKKGLLPSDICFKTYCTAAPKPGNLFFAYDLEYAARGGWLFNVVNPNDWVPEVPFSLQALNDFNSLNIFSYIRDETSSTFRRMFVNHYLETRFNTASKPQKEYIREFGAKKEKELKKLYPGFMCPEFYPTANYVRTGITIVLKPNHEYLKKYDTPDAGAFLHHMHHLYIDLIRELE
ncbi:MAG: lipase family protein [Bacteroidales bacterium]|nr:lipase family protein [Bacteroidales bacterium]